LIRVGEAASAGSVSVARQLLDARLLDELHLFVHPATAGLGLKLFEEGGPARHLKLISAQPFQSGVVHLAYAPDPNPPTGSYEEAKTDLPPAGRKHRL
jgi:dihydrofolate reductase